MVAERLVQAPRTRPKEQGVKELLDAIVIYPPKDHPPLNVFEQAHMVVLLAQIFNRWPSVN